MKKADIAATINKLNRNQEYALERALHNGEHTRQTKGKKRLVLADCGVGGYRSVVNPQTSRALTKRGLLTPARWGYNKYHLTSNGRAVASELIRRSLAEDNEGPTTVEELVANQIAEVKRDEDEHTEKIARAKTLWRGIKLAESRYVGSGIDRRSRAMTAVISEEFERRSLRSGLTLHLEDLIAIGEQIQERRR